MLDTPIYEEPTSTERVSPGLGVPVRLPHGPVGLIVAADAVRADWWLVKLHTGRCVWVSASGLDTLS